MRIITQFRLRCEEWMADAKALCLRLNMPTTEQALRHDLESLLADPTIRVVVCGEWNTGKSTLLNALVGVPDLLPSDINPCTTHVIRVEKGEHTAWAVSRNGRLEPLTEVLFRSLCESAEPDPSIDYLWVQTPVRWCEEPLILVDTPGLEDLCQTRADITLGYLPHADVIVLVFEATAGLKGTDRRFIRQYLTRRETRRVIAVLNKSDLLGSQSAVDRKLRWCQSAIKEELPEAIWVVTSAHRACQALHERPDIQSEDGITQLREQIATTVRQERGSYLALRFVRRARQHLHSLSGRLEAEIAGLALSLTDVQSRIADIRKRVAETASRQDDLFRLVQQDIRVDIDSWMKQELATGMAAFSRNVEASIEAIGSIDDARTFINTDVLGRRASIQLRNLSEDFQQSLARSLQQAIAKHGSDALGVNVQPVEVVHGISRPIETLWKHVPESVVAIGELAGAALLAIGGALTKSTKLKPLLILLKNLPQLDQLRPSEWIKSHLVERVREELPKMKCELEQVFRDHAKEVGDNVMASVRADTRAQIQSVEIGLEESQAHLARGLADAERRRIELGQLQAELRSLSTRLEALAVVEPPQQP